MCDKSLEKVKIRRFEKRDKEMVQEFFNQMGSETVSFFNVNHGNEKRTMGFFTGERNDHIFWAATVDTDCGELMVGLIFIWDIGTAIPWLGIAVRDDWKGCHLGRLLLENIKSFAAEKNYGGILLRTSANNLRGKGLYERCGFERLGTHPSGEYLYLLRFGYKENNT